MNQESVSNLVVAMASVVLGVACLVMACGAFVAWQARSKDRMKRQLAAMSQQLRAVTDRLQPPEGRVGHPSA